MTKIKTLVNGNLFDVEVIERDRNSASFIVKGRTYKVELAESMSRASDAPEKSGGNSVRIQSSSLNNSSTSTDSNLILAPIPGLLVGIDVAQGDSVAEGQVLLRLEAMKMENSIVSPKNAKIESIEVELGDEVMDGQILIRLS
jgi:biotin carboxyl carrier protein